MTLQWVGCSWNHSIFFWCVVFTLDRQGTYHLPELAVQNSPDIRRIPLSTRTFKPSYRGTFNQCALRLCTSPKSFGVLQKSRTWFLCLITWLYLCFFKKGITACYCLRLWRYNQIFKHNQNVRNFCITTNDFGEVHRTTMHTGARCRPLNSVHSSDGFWLKFGKNTKTKRSF